MRHLTEKQALFCKYMFTVDSKSIGNGTESARRGGYKGTDSCLAVVAYENIRKPKIIAEKQRIQAETVEKLNIDRDYCIKQARDILETSKVERNRLTAISLLADFIGAKRDTAPNAEAEAAKLARLTAEDRKLAEESAQRRTAEEAVEVVAFKAIEV